MPRFKNFSIWRNRLPHWRADDVTYYVTFRHRRALDERERALLFANLLRPEKRRWDLLVLCVLPETTELMFRVRQAPTGKPYELSVIVERAKKKAGAAIVKKTGERWPPFYEESYDRIVRDDAEFEERWTGIRQAPLDKELCEDPDAYETQFIQLGVE